MDQLLAWLSRILDSWKFWIVIAPWEIGVRIRLGKTATSISAGLHLRIPFVDAITLVNTRLRIDGTPPITVKGKNPNYTRYITGTVGYRVSDPLKAMLKFGLPYSVVVSKAQQEIASFCNEEESLKSLQTYFNNDCGISIDFIKFVEDVEVKTYRFINATAWVASGHESTSGPNSAMASRY